MKDDLICLNWKTTSTFFKMEDNIYFSENGRQPQFFENGRQPNFFLQKKDCLNILKNRRRPKKTQKKQHILPGNLTNTTNNSKLAQFKQKNQP